MSNIELEPDEFFACAGDRPNCAAASDSYVPVEVIESRAVPLGGPRSMTVNRTLPQRKRFLIGAWCFVDHYGPDDVSATGGMDVAPHPHTGLQTVSWLFDGEIQHNDSGGHHGLVRPGEVNLMTAGGGIAHSETSTAATTTLRGAQLWIALPDRVRSVAPRKFEHYVPERIQFAGGSALVFVGSLLGATSPVEVFSELVGAEITIDPHAAVEIAVNPDFEHGVLVDAGQVRLEDVAVPRTALGYTGIGATTLHIANDSDAPARILLIGGTPFGEEIVMWWNFIARSHDEIVQFREQWQARSEVFGQVEGYVGQGGPNQNAAGMSWLPAPKLPSVVIKPRRNPAPKARPE